MPIDSEPKRRSVTNLSSGGSIGLLQGNGIDVEERPNVSRIYGFLDYIGLLEVPLTNLMILYPIQPTALSNKIVFQKDSREYSEVRKSGSLWRHEITSLRFRIFGIAQTKIFYEFHIANRNTLVSLNTPGYQPFVRSGSVNTVRILDFTPYQNIDPLNYEITVTYRHSLRTATT